MIRDLVDVSIEMVREEKLETVAERAEANAEERMLDLLMPPQEEGDDSVEKTREKLRASLREGLLDERMVDIDVREKNLPVEIVTSTGTEEMDINLRDMLPGLFGGKTRRRKMRVGEGAGLSHPRGRAETHRHGPGDPPGARARRAVEHHLPRRDG